jgi:membrane-associated protein
MELLTLLANLDGQIASFIAAHGNLVYLLLFSVVFLEIGVFPLFFLPGNPLIFIAGSFCKIGSLHLISTALILLIAGLLGNLVSYQIGNAFGRKIAHSQSPWANQKALGKTKHFYTQYGQYALMASPFIAVIRTFAPLLAGVSQMPKKQYLFASTIGSVIWVGLLMLAGYFFSSIPFIKMHMASIVITGLMIGLGFVLYGLIRSKLE